MGNTKKLFAYVLSGFLFFAVNTAAQTNTESQNTAEPPAGTQNTQGNLDTINSTESIVVDTAKNSSYHQIARDMTIKLLQKMNISFDQAADIEEILIGYQEDIAEAKNRGTASGTDQSVTDTDTEQEDRTATEDDREILGGMDNDENLREIDQEANSEIEEVLSDDQMNAYLFVKEDWWNEVKSKVYGTEDQNLDNLQNTDQNLNNQENTEQDINNQQNTDENIQDQGTEQQNQEQQGETGTDTSPDTGRTGEQNTAPADTTYHK